MKRKIFTTLALVIVAMCLFVIVASASDTEATTCYLVQDDTSELATNLKNEGKNVVGIANLYSDVETPFFSTFADGDNIVLELAENINYVPSEKSSSLTASVFVKIEKAITVTILFKEYSWWISSDNEYSSIMLNNENATLRLIGGKLTGEAQEIKNVDSYSASVNTNDIDFYGGYVGIYVSCGNIYAENFLAIGQEELIYRADNMNLGVASYEFKNCSIDSKKSLAAVGDKKSKNIADISLSVDGGYYGGMQFNNLIASSVRNATIGTGADGNSFFVDSWKGVNAYEIEFENVEFVATFFSEGDSNLILANNCTFATINLKGDGSGGADAIITDSTYKAVVFTGNKGTGTLTVITSATCTEGGKRVIISYSNGANIETPDEAYAQENPAKGHIISAPTGVHYDNYFEMGAYTGICEYCKEQAAETTPSAPAFVTSKGVSCFNNGEAVAVTQGFVINKTALAYFGEDVDFGVIAAVNSGTEEFAPEIGSSSAVTGSLKGGNFVITNVKISNIPAQSIETKLVFCMYLRIDDTVYYLNNGATGKSIVGLSYNDVAAM